MLVPPLKLYRRILRYVSSYRGVLAIAIAGMVLVASTDVMMLLIVRPLLNNIGAVDVNATWWVPFTIVGVFVLRGIGSYVSEYGLAWIGSRVVFEFAAKRRHLRVADAFLRCEPAVTVLQRHFRAQQIAARLPTQSRSHCATR